MPRPLSGALLFLGYVLFVWGLGCWLVTFCCADVRLCCDAVALRGCIGEYGYLCNDICEKLKMTVILDWKV